MPPQGDQAPPAQDFQTLILAFLDYLSVECGLSPNTLAAYRSDLFKFLRFLSERSVARLDLMTTERVIGFLMDLKDRGAHVNTLARHLVAVKMFFRFLWTEGHTSREITSVLQSPKLWRYLPEPGTQHDGPPGDGAERTLTRTRGTSRAGRRSKRA